LFHKDGITSVELVDGESGIAPGQACVLYADDSNDSRVLGGGTIARSERAPEAEAMLTRLAAAE
jgi:tRNA-specific 2-thiouridylase